MIKYSAVMEKAFYSVSAFLFFWSCETAMAITAPTSGAFGYTVYDIAVEKILKGPIGFVGAVACIVLGATMAVKNQLMIAVPAFIGGGLLLKADTIVTSLGILF